MFDTATHAARRRRVAAALEGGVAVIAAGPPPARTRAMAYAPYRPGADFFWLTGFAEPGGVLVLAPDRATVFVPPADPVRERWDGPRLGPAAAADALGVDAAFGLDALDAELPRLLAGAEPLWHGFGREPGLDARLLAHWPRPAAVRDPARLLAGLRVVKDEAEIALMREAARVTALGFEAVRPLLAAGVPEHALEAALIGAWRAAGADGPAYAPIVAGGPHATVLHHHGGDRRLAAGEGVLIDAGCAWRGYACDVTRTWGVGPATGLLAAAREVVLAAHAAALDAVGPGLPTDGPQRAAEAVLAAGLRELGVDAPLADHFPHGIGHWIGLEVHDPGPARGEGVFVAGQALTIEPGLYFPAEGVRAGVGVRHEDTVLVTATGHENLTAGITAGP